MYRPQWILHSSHLQDDVHLRVVVASAEILSGGGYADTGYMKDGVQLGHSVSNCSVGPPGATIFDVIGMYRGKDCAYYE